MVNHRKHSLRKITAFLLSLALVASPVGNFGPASTVKAENVESTISLIESNGYEEGAYVEWAPVDGADGYLVYVSQDQSSWTQIDDELIRNYGTYMRADALGLTAGKWYVKIEAATFDTGRAKTGTVAETVQEVDVVAHDRSGYAWEGNGTSSGAYNEDGSLREDANVIYITEATKDTVSLEVTGAAMNPCVGLQDILEEYRDGEETKPLCIRVIGNITTPSYTSDDDIRIDGITVGMTLEGVGEDAVANGWGIYIKNSSNVEVRNMAFMNRSMNGSQDTVGLQENNDHIWVHHCDMFYGGVGSEDEQDKGDGALDCKRSTYVTVSYNHLWDTGLSCLLGLDEGTTEGLYATYHHNWFDHSDGRHPRVRYYSTHVYNNYYDGNCSYGVGSTMGSSIFVENNYFRNCYHPIMTSKQGTDVYGGRTGNFSGEDGGTVKAFNNYMTGQRRFVAYREVDDPATDWNETTDFDAYVATSRDERVPESVVSLQGGNTYNNFDTAADFYEYQLTETENVPAVVMAGAGRVNGGDFKWEFDDATADKSSNVDEELRAACLAYTSDLVSVGGILGSSTTAYYTVTFDPGNGEATSSVEVEAYQTVAEPMTPTVVPEGKDFFAGWYNGATKWNFADPVTCDMTLNGKWLVEGEGLNPAALYNLRLNLKNVPTGTYTAPFTRGGFTVNAWSSTKRDVVVDANTKSINGTSYTQRLKLYGAGTKDYRNIVFTAKAAAELQIGCMANSSGTYQMGVATLDENGDFVDLKGTVNVDGVAMDCSDGNIPVTSASAQYITLEIPEAGTYYIYGKDGEINFYFLNLIYENGVEGPCYTVSFDAMGGLSVNAQEVVVGERCIKPADTFRDGYVFGGWYEDAACTTAYNFTTPVTSDITLYAKWIEDETEGANLILDMQELPVRDYTENFGKNGFSFYASASKYLSVDASSATVEGVKYPQRLRLNGGGSTSARSISFTIEEDATLTLVAASGNTNEARTLIVTDGTTAYTIANISSAAKFTQTLGAGTWYVYSSRSGINIYYIAVQAADGDDGDVSDGDASGGDVSDGDASGGDVSDGDASDGDVTDGDPDGGSKPLPEGLYVELAEPGAEYVYTGSAIKPAIIVYNNGEELAAGVDYTVKYSNNTNVSTDKKSAKITVTGKGNLTGSNSTTFKILPKDIGDDDIVEGAIVVAKNSKATPVLMYNNKKLTTKNYTIEDAKKKYTEDGVMKLTGKGNFTGTREIPVKVVEKSELKKFTVTVDTKMVLTYDGEDKRSAIAAAVTVKDKKDKTKILVENQDYILDWSNSNTVDAGTVKFTVLGINSYTGSVAKTYKIKPLVLKEGISFDAASIDTEGYTFVSGGVKIDEDIVVKYGDTELVQGKDYKVTYSNNKKVSTTKSQAKFTISFLGNYKGSKALKGTFKINTAPLSNDTEGIKIVTADKVYTKKNVYKSAPIVTIDGVTLKSSNYKVTYYTDAEMTKEMNSKNKIELGENEASATVYVKIEGKGNYKPVNGEYVTTEYQVVKKATNDVDLSKARVTFVDAAGKKLTKVEYTGNELEPTVKVEVKQKVNGKNQWVTVDASNYEVTYANNVNKGTATAVVTATGEGYAGSKTAKFKVVSKNLKWLPDLFKDLFGILSLN